MKHIKNILLLAAGILFCLVIPVGLKELVLKPVRAALFIDETAGRLFQWSISLVMIAAGYWLFVRIFEKRPAMELLSPGSLIHLPVYTFFGIGSIAIITVILYAAGGLTFMRDSVQYSEFYLLLLLFLLCFTEEILYRGIIYRLIEKWYGTYAALGISALLFSVSHFFNSGFNIQSFIEILFGGAAMGLLFSLKRSLWAPVGFHFGWNYAQTAFGFTLSGLEDFSGLSLLNGKLSGGTLLSGGEFGIENSIVTIIYTVLMTIYLMILLRCRMRNRSVIPDF